MSGWQPPSDQYSNSWANRGQGYPESHSHQPNNPRNGTGRQGQNSQGSRYQSQNPQQSQFGGPPRTQQQYGRNPQAYGHQQPGPRLYQDPNAINQIRGAFHYQSNHVAESLQNAQPSVPPRQGIWAADPASRNRHTPVNHAPGQQVPLVPLQSRRSTEYTTHSGASRKTSVPVPPQQNLRSAGAHPEQVSSMQTIGKPITQRSSITSASAHVVNLQSRSSTDVPLGTNTSTQQPVDLHLTVGTTGVLNSSASSKQAAEPHTSSAGHISNSVEIHTEDRMQGAASTTQDNQPSATSELQANDAVGSPQKSLPVIQTNPQSASAHSESTSQVSQTLLQPSGDTALPPSVVANGFFTVGSVVVNAGPATSAPSSHVGQESVFEPAAPDASLENQPQLVESNVRSEAVADSQQQPAPQTASKSGPMPEQATASHLSTSQSNQTLTFAQKLRSPTQLPVATRTQEADVAAKQQVTPTRIQHTSNHQSPDTDKQSAAPARHPTSSQASSTPSTAAPVSLQSSTAVVQSPNKDNDSDKAQQTGELSHACDEATPNGAGASPAATDTTAASANIMTAEPSGHATTDVAASATTGAAAPKVAWGAKSFASAIANASTQAPSQKQQQQSAPTHSTQVRDSGNRQGDNKTGPARGQRRQQPQQQQNTNQTAQQGQAQQQSSGQWQQAGRKGKDQRQDSGAGNSNHDRSNQRAAAAASKPVSLAQKSVESSKDHSDSLLPTSAAPIKTAPAAQPSLGSVSSSKTTTPKAAASTSLPTAAPVASPANSGAKSWAALAKQPTPVSVRTVGSSTSAGGSLVASPKAGTLSSKTSSDFSSLAHVLAKAPSVGRASTEPPTPLTHTAVRPSVTQSPQVSTASTEPAAATHTSQHTPVQQQQQPQPKNQAPVSKPQLAPSGPAKFEDAASTQSHTPQDTSVAQPAEDKASRPLTMAEKLALSASQRPALKPATAPSAAQQQRPGKLVNNQGKAQEQTTQLQPSQQQKVPTQAAAVKASEELQPSHETAVNTSELVQPIMPSIAVDSTTSTTDTVEPLPEVRHMTSQQSQSAPATAETVLETTSASQDSLERVEPSPPEVHPVQSDSQNANAHPAPVLVPEPSQPNTLETPATQQQVSKSWAGIAGVVGGRPQPAAAKPAAKPIAPATSPTLHKPQAQHATAATHGAQHHHGHHSPDYGQKLGAQATAAAAAQGFQYAHAPQPGQTSAARPGKAPAQIQQHVQQVQHAQPQISQASQTPQVQETSEPQEDDDGFQAVHSRKHKQKEQTHAHQQQQQQQRKGSGQSGGGRQSGGRQDGGKGRQQDQRHQQQQGASRQQQQQQHTAVPSGQKVPVAVAAPSAAVLADHPAGAITTSTTLTVPDVITNTPGATTDTPSTPTSVSGGASRSGGGAAGAWAKGSLEMKLRQQTQLQQLDPRSPTLGSRGASPALDQYSTMSVAGSSPHMSAATSPRSQTPEPPYMSVGPVSESGSTTATPAAAAAGQSEDQQEEVHSKSLETQEPVAGDDSVSPLEDQRHDDSKSSTRSYMSAVGDAVDAAGSEGGPAAATTARQDDDEEDEAVGTMTGSNLFSALLDGVDEPVAEAKRKPKVPTTTAAVADAGAAAADTTASTPEEVARRELMALVDLGKEGQAKTTDDQATTTNRFTPRGFINTGNSCFINAPLQALLGCAPFCSLLMKFERTAPLLDASQTPTLHGLAALTSQLLAGAPTGAPPARSPSPAPPVAVTAAVAPAAEATNDAADNASAGGNALDALGWSEVSAKPKKKGKGQTIVLGMPGTGSAGKRNQTSGNAKSGNVRDGAASPAPSNTSSTAISALWRQPLMPTALNEVIRKFSAKYGAGMDSPATLTAAQLMALKTSGVQHQEQQDAQEFLHFLLDHAHEELLLLAKSAQSQGPDSEDAAGCEDDGEEWAQVGKKNKAAVVRVSGVAGGSAAIRTAINTLFSGATKSVIKCGIGKPSATATPFMMLHLDIDLPVVTDLDTALAHHLAPSNIEYKPEGSAVAVPAVQQHFLYRLPQLLVIHLKRFSMHNGNTVIKYHKHVAFDVQLRLRKPIVGEDCPDVGRAGFADYHLVATVSHHGKHVTGGHYTADVRQADGTWLRFNDTQVDAVSQATVLQEEPYILMYQRAVAAQ